MPLRQRSKWRVKTIFRTRQEKTQDDVKLEESLQKTRSSFFGRIGALFQENEITDELWEEVEEILIRGDVGMTVTAGCSIAVVTRPT